MPDQRIVSVIFGDNERVMIGLNPRQKPNPVLDMATLCEGIVLLIRAANKDGIKKEADSLRDCLNHLKKGFVDESYKVLKSPGK